MRNRRFNEELEILQQQLRDLEREHLKTKELLKSVQALRSVITRELSFENGFSDGVMDALLDHIVVSGTRETKVIRTTVYLKAVPEPQISKQNGRLFRVDIYVML